MGAVDEREAEIVYLERLLPILTKHGVRKYDLRSQSLEFYPQPLAAAAEKALSAFGHVDGVCKCGHTNPEHNEHGLCVQCPDCTGWQERTGE